MSTPSFTATEANSRSTFLALMWALSYPGRAQPLIVQTEPFRAIADTLLDLETSCYTPESEQKLSAYCQQTTARTETIQRADYLFFPTLQESDLPALADARIGTMLYPDQAATLIIGCKVGEGTTLHLAGPGIQGNSVIRVGGIPVEFWTLREKTRRYPLGWDIFLVAGLDVIGLPRSTMIAIK